MNAVRAIVFSSLLIAIGLAVLCESYRQTASHYKQINADLLAEQAKPHPIHDVHVTIFRNAKGDVTAWVAGMFPHTAYGMCAAESHPF